MADYRIENHIAELSTKNYLKEYRNQQEFIKYCQACPSYQNSWACPPFEYDPLSRIQHFSYTYIIGSQIHFEQEFINKSIDLNIEQVSRQVMKEVRAVIDPLLLSVEQSKGTALAFFAGNCHYCLNRDCTRKENKPCRFPTRIRPSLEAYGFDIAKTTAKVLELELKWGKNGCLPPYFILVSGLMSQQRIPNCNSYFR